jgi:hypothetical protein
VVLVISICIFYKIVIHNMCYLFLCNHCTWIIYVPSQRTGTWLVFVNGLKLTVSLSCYTHAGWRLNIMCVVLILVLFLECNVGMAIDCCTVCGVPKAHLQWSLMKLCPPQATEQFESLFFFGKSHFTTHQQISFLIWHPIENINSI